MGILCRAYPPLFEASDLLEVAGAPSSNVSDMMTLMFSGKVLGIQEVAPFWWESTKNSSIESTGTSTQEFARIIRLVVGNIILHTTLKYF